MEDLIAVSIEEIGLDGEQGCSFSRLVDLHLKRRFPSALLDALTQQFLLDYLLQTSAIDCFPAFPGEYKLLKKGEVHARPSCKSELAKQPRERQIQWMEEKKLVFVASIEYRRFLLVGSRDIGASQEALFFILDVIGRGRELGFVQAEFGKLGVKSDLVFHFLKSLEDDNLITRVSVISDKMATNLCVLKKFAAKVTHPDTIFYENMVFKANLRQRILRYVSEATNKTLLSKDIRQLLANDCDAEVVNRSAKLLKREFDCLVEDKLVEQLNVELGGHRQICLRLLPPPDAKEDLHLPQSSDLKFTYEHPQYYQLYRIIEQAGPAGITIRELSEKSGNSHKKTHKLVQNLTDSSLVDNSMREFEGKEKRARIIAKNQLHLSADYQVFQSCPATLTGIAEPKKEEPVLAGSEPSSRQPPQEVAMELALLEEDGAKPDPAQLKTEPGSTPKKPIMSVNAIRRAKLIVDKIKEVRVLDLVELKDFLEKSEGKFYSIDRKSLCRIVEPLVEQGVLRTQTTTEKRMIVIDATLDDDRLVEDYIQQLRATGSEKRKIQKVFEIDDVEVENLFPKRVKNESEGDGLPLELAQDDSKLARVKALYNFIWETVFETPLADERGDEVVGFWNRSTTFDLGQIIPRLPLKLYGNSIGFCLPNKSFIQDPLTFSRPLAEFTSEPEVAHFTKELSQSKIQILNLLDGMEYLNLVSFLRDESDTTGEAGPQDNLGGLRFMSRIYSLNKTVALFGEPQAEPEQSDEDVPMTDAEEPPKTIVMNSPSSVALLWHHLTHSKTLKARLPSKNKTQQKFSAYTNIATKVSTRFKVRLSKRERLANRRKPSASTGASKDKSGRLVVVRTVEENEQLIRLFTIYRSYLLTQRVVNSYMWSKFVPILGESESNNVKLRLSKLLEDPQVALRVRKESTLAALQLKPLFKLGSKSRVDAGFDFGAAIGEYNKLSIPKNTVPVGFSLDQQETVESLSKRYVVHEYQKEGDQFGLEAPLLYGLERQLGPSSIPYIAQSSPVQQASETEESTQLAVIETLLKVICNMPESPDFQEKSAALLAQFTEKQQAEVYGKLLDQGTLVKNKGGPNPKSHHFGERLTLLLKEDKLSRQTRNFVETLSGQQASEEVTLSDDSSKVFGILDLVSRGKMGFEIDQDTNRIHTSENSMEVKVKYSLKEGVVRGEDERRPEPSPALEFLKTFPKPWFDLDKNFLPHEFQRFANAVLHAICSAPGISQDRLVEKLSLALNEKEVIALATHLESTHNVATREVYKSPVVPSLFSPQVEVSDTPKPGFIKIISYFAETDYYKSLPETL